MWLGVVFLALLVWLTTGVSGRVEDGLLGLGFICAKFFPLLDPSGRRVIAGFTGFCGTLWPCLVYPTNWVVLAV